MTAAAMVQDPTELEELVERLVARVFATGESITVTVDRYLPQGRRHWTEQTARELTRLGLQRCVTKGLSDHNAGRGVGIDLTVERDGVLEATSPPRTAQAGAPHPKELPPVLRTMADIQLATVDGSRVTLDKGTLADFEYWEQRFSAQKEGLAAREYACTTAKKALREHRVACPSKLPQRVRVQLDEIFLNAWRKGVGA